MKARLVTRLDLPGVLAIFAAFGVRGMAQRPAGDTSPIPYADARPILEQLRARLPSELASKKTPGDLESAWPGWVARRNAAIRARLEQGDEDSLINFLLFGTRFTRGRAR